MILLRLSLRGILNIDKDFVHPTNNENLMVSILQTVTILTIFKLDVYLYAMNLGERK